MTSFGVTLLSGGLDSTTVTQYAKDRVDHMVFAERGTWFDQADESGVHWHIRTYLLSF